MLESNSPKSHKAHSYVKPFSGFTNLVHLTKSYGSGLLLNISEDLSIIDRPILISYVSIATTRTYEVGHVASLYAHIRMYLLVLQARECIRNPSVLLSVRPIFPRHRSSLCLLARDHEYKEEMKLIRGNQMHAATRIPATHSGMITLTYCWDNVPSAWTDFRRGQSCVRSVHAFARPHKRMRGSRS